MEIIDEHIATSEEEVEKLELGINRQDRTEIIEVRSTSVTQILMDYV